MRASQTVRRVVQEYIVIMTVIEFQSTYTNKCTYNHFNYEKYNFVFTSHYNKLPGAKEN